MANQCICNGLLAQIPDLDVVVDATGEQLVACFGQAYGSYGKIGGDKGYCVLGSGVPDLLLLLDISWGRKEGALTPM